MRVSTDAESCKDVTINGTVMDTGVLVCTTNCFKTKKMGKAQCQF